MFKWLEIQFGVCLSTLFDFENYSFLWIIFKYYCYSGIIEVLHWGKLMFLLLI